MSYRYKRRVLKANRFDTIEWTVQAVNKGGTTGISSFSNEEECEMPFFVQKN